jgi:hypothetical protein
MNTALAALLILEMLDRIGHVNRSTVQSDLIQSLIENQPGWSHERPTRAVFQIAGLFANQHDSRPDRPFAEDKLRRVQIQGAPLAMGSLLPNLV